MRRILIIYCLISWFNSGAQPIFKTVIPQQPVITGESFLVQYVLEDVNKEIVVKPPPFSGFRLINGPNIYRGSIPGLQAPIPVQNFVYTIEAGNTGKYIIPGATAIVNGKFLKSNDILIEVISQKEAARLYDKRSEGINSGYFLRPGEDPYEKIRQNLFLRVMVDKRNCFAGQPVVATFKLYSRLESKSDIVKNPGFYGFAAYDMVNLADNEVRTELINGQSFDVHTVRQVQLYPFQAGNYTIDPMEVKNKVEFSRSAVNKKTEQEIVEGVLGWNGEDKPANSEEYEMDLNTPPVTIHVKSLGEKNKPPGFNGAVGNFNISVKIIKDELAKNEMGILEITVSGQGNFIQLSAPPIQWPPGLEVFEPTVYDSLDKKSSPLTGRRSFRYAFVSSSPGVYNIPPVSFSFFKTDSGDYKIISTPVQKVLIRNEEKKAIPEVQDLKTKSTTQNKSGWWIAGLLVLTGIALGIVIWQRRKRSSLQTKILPLKKQLPVDEILAPATLLVHGDETAFYSYLRESVWRSFSYYFELSGSGMSREALFAAMKRKGFDETTIAGTDRLLQQCEAGMFTKARLSTNKDELVQQTREILELIEKKFYSEYL